MVSQAPGLLLHSHIMEFTFPVIILNIHMSFPFCRQEQSSLAEISALEAAGQTGSFQSTLSIRLVFPGLSPHTRRDGSLCRRLLGEASLASCWGGGQGRPHTQWSPPQLDHAVGRRLLLREEHLAWRGLCGLVLSTLGMRGSGSMPRRPRHHRARGCLAIAASLRPVCCGLRGDLGSIDRWHSHRSRVLDFNLGACGRTQKPDWLRTSLTVHTFILFPEGQQPPANTEASCFSTYSLSPKFTLRLNKKAGSVDSNPPRLSSLPRSTVTWHVC